MDIGWSSWKMDCHDKAKQSSWKPSDCFSSLALVKTGHGLEVVVSEAKPLSRKPSGCYGKWAVVIETRYGRHRNKIVVLEAKQLSRKLSGCYGNRAVVAETGRSLWKLGSRQWPFVLETGQWSYKPNGRHGNPDGRHGNRVVIVGAARWSLKSSSISLSRWVWQLSPKRETPYLTLSHN